MLLTLKPHPPPAQNGIRGGPSHEYSVVHQSIPSTTIRDSPTVPAPAPAPATTATRSRPRQLSEPEYPSASVMDSSRRNLVPPPSSRTLPPPPPLTATPPQLPPPPLSQWQTQAQTQTQNNSQPQTQAPPPSDNDSMQIWLQAKTEEDRKKQEEEKSRQESLRLEQRVIEHSMLRDALQAGVPPHMIPLIFAGISGGSLPQVALDLTQQYMSTSVGQPATSSSMPPPHQPQPHPHHHAPPHPPPSSGIDMSSSTLPPPPPPQSMPHYSQQPGMPHLRRKSLYAAQPQIPPPKETLPSQPLSISGGFSPIRQSLGHPSLPPSGPPAMPLLSHGSEIQNHHHQINPNNTQYTPGSSGPPPQSASGKDYQYRPRQPSNSIYFHHWVPPGQSQSHTASGGKEQLAPSHSHSHSRSEYHSSPGRKRKAQAGHQPGSSRSRQNSPAGVGRKPSQRGHHLRQRSDASAFEPQTQETEEADSNSNHATPNSMPQSTSDKGHPEVKPESSTLEGSPSSKRRKSEAPHPSKLENNNHQSYDSDRSSRREMSKTPPKTAPSVTDDDEPGKHAGDQ